VKDILYLKNSEGYDFAYTCRWLFNEKVKKGTERDEDSISKSDWETSA
jgi:hypothetical protein